MEENEDILTEEEIIRILLEEEEEKRRLERYKHLGYKRQEDEKKEEITDNTKDENQLEQSLEPSSIPKEREEQIIYALEQQEITDKVEQHAKTLKDVSSNVQSKQYLDNLPLQSTYTTNAAVDLQYEQHKKEQEATEQKNPFKTRVDDHVVN